MTDLTNADRAINEAANIAASKAVMTFDYWNHRGDFDRRAITPISFRYGRSEYHQVPQWLLTAKDIGKGALREFAMRDMSTVRMMGPLEVSGPAVNVSRGFEVLKRLRELTPTEFAVVHREIDNLERVLRGQECP